MDNAAATKQLTDNQLALEAGSGSRQCFDELVSRYTPRLFHFLRRKTPTDQDAEDLTQDTILKAFRYIESFDPRWKFSTWIYTIAGRTLASYYRSPRSRESLPLTEMYPSEEAPRETGVMDAQNLWLQAREVLKPDQYQVLWLRYTESMSVKEIASVMKKTGIHVRVLLHRARSNLAGLVAPAPFPTSSRSSSGEGKGKEKPALS